MTGLSRSSVDRAIKVAKERGLYTFTRQRRGPNEVRVMSVQLALLDSRNVTAVTHQEDSRNVTAVTHQEDSRNVTAVTHQGDSRNVTAVTHQESAPLEGSRARVAPVPISSSLVSISIDNDDELARARSSSSSFLQKELNGMSASSADAIAARLAPHEVEAWVDCVRYKRKNDPAGWLYATIVKGGATKLPADYVRHREAQERERQRLLAGSEVDARRRANAERTPEEHEAGRAALADIKAKLFKRGASA
jgi:hypothetical protein